MLIASDGFSTCCITLIRPFYLSITKYHCGHVHCNVHLYVRTYVCQLPPLRYFHYYHSTKKPVTTMLTYAWKCTVLHCNHLGNTWKPLVLMTQHFDYCPSASEGDNQCRVISTSGFQVFPRWLQCKTVHFQG